MNKKIYIVTGDKYPEGDAGAIRQHCFAKMCDKLGYEVSVIGYGKHTGNKFEKFDNIRYTSLRPNTENILIRFLMRITSGFRYLKVIKKMPKPTAILIIDPGNHAIKKIEKYSVKNNIRLIHDSVEWYSKEQFDKKEKDISYILKDKLNSEILNKNFKIIAISKYLEKYYSSKNISSVRIPVILDVVNTEFIKTTRKEYLTLVYAGTPTKKDYLKEIINGFLLLSPEELKCVKIKIIGVTPTKLKEVCELDDEKLRYLSSNLVVMGRIPHCQVLCELEEADFTILLRDSNLRYSKAGFPTKVVESLTTATPVILNYSSDLSDYITDMKEGIIVSDCTSEAFAQAIRKAINISFEQRINMQNNARKCAEENFDYRLYVNTMKGILEE